LAEAYEKSGKLPFAREEYEKILMLTNGRLLQGYTYAISFYRLGKICEQQNDRAKAIENYGKFIDLWKNADRIFPEVEDAKTRLAALMPR
jgi:tetratricopeptide (TPR) repeat protein